jgi:anti-sigma regulatory factor (Ser/Thr protein kinase)
MEVDAANCCSVANHMTDLLQTPHRSSLVHEALFYAGTDEFVDRCAAFVREGRDAGEPVLVLVVARKVELLKRALGAAADGVLFGDMAEIGRNPARIIPVWREFVDEHSSVTGTVRGIGEPIWAERSADELIESQRHESLINLAFPDAPAWIICPYDTIALGDDVIAEARRSHPLLSDKGTRAHSGECLDNETIARAFDAALPDPPVKPLEVAVDIEDLGLVRAFVSRYAADHGLARARVSDLVMAVNELMTNSVRHGGGSGVLRIWNDGAAIVCEVRDAGHIGDALVGRRRPDGTRESGYGMWLVNQLCDLVQVRSYPGGAVVRLHMSRVL